MMLALAGAEVRQADFELRQLDVSLHGLAGAKAGQAVSDSQHLERKRSRLILRKLQALRCPVTMCCAVQLAI